MFDQPSLCYIVWSNNVPIIVWSLHYNIMTDPDTRQCDETNNRAVHLTACHTGWHCIPGQTQDQRTKTNTNSAKHQTQLRPALRPRQQTFQTIDWRETRYLCLTIQIIFILQILSFLVVVGLLGPRPVNTFGIIGEALQAFQCGCGCRFYDVGTCETRTKKECKVGWSSSG